MFELDVASGTVTCNQYEINKALTHEVFAKRYLGFGIIEERHHTWGLTEKVYGMSVHLTSTQMGFLSICYFNQNIAHIHIDAAEMLDFAAAKDSVEAEKAWWNLQEQWIPMIRHLMESKLGKPQHVEPSKLFDETTFLDATSLKQLQNWTYRFLWGQAGLAYVSEDWSYRLWISYDAKLGE